LDLKLPITIFDELDEEVVESTGSLDLASGEITDVHYLDYDVAARDLPAERDNYAFTSGTLSHNGKDVEFRVDVERMTGKYHVTPSELLDVKVRAARLFAGIEGKDLLGGGAQKPGAAAPGKKKLH
jgi:hypothetical protein